MHWLLGVVLFVTICTSLEGCSSTASQKSKTAETTGEVVTNTTTVQKLFEEYKARDLANDPKIIDLYADDSSVSLSGKVYTKKEYADYVSSAYASAAGQLNKNTQYTELQVLGQSGNSAEGRFSASLGPTNMTVYWMLKRLPNGDWKISNETFGFGR